MQSLTIDETSFSLEFDGQKLHVKNFEPTQEDYDTLLTHEFTSSCTFTSESDAPPKPRRLNNKT